ncbi:MAG: hypothetical protein H7A51_16490 [Akkermansiaceae bacterium]|nr:hypothetical protein [Akkermansiaceae bacterium]
MYNVLEKLRSGEPLTAKEKTIHDDGLVTLLKQIHDDIDRTVFEAYGWQDIWQWQQDAMRGSCYDPETDLVSRLEIESASLTEAIAPFLEKYQQVLLQRLVDLNHQRAAEEAQGRIRYLRPDFQNPDGTAPERSPELIAAPAVIQTVATSGKAGKLKWPKELSDRVTVLRPLLTTALPDAAALSQLFGRKSPKREKEIQDILNILQTLGHL